MRSSLSPPVSVLEKVIQEHLKNTYAPKRYRSQPWNEHDVRFFASGVRELHRLFTTGSADRRRDYLSFPELRSAYLAYFLPVNVAKAIALLSRYRLFAGVASLKKTLHLVDVGAGPLTMTLGFLQAMAPSCVAPIEIHVEALEQNARIVSEGRLILEAWLKAAGFADRIKVTVRSISGDARRTRFSGGPADLVLMGNILGEMADRDAQQDFVLGLWRRTAGPQTRWFFIEPSTKRVSRDLQALRDRLIAETGAKILAPCLHQKQCPLNLTAKADWCHFTLDWEVPSLVQAFDKVCGLKKSYLAYSYLLLDSGEAAHVPCTTRDFIAISYRMRDRSGESLVGCGPAGRWHFTMPHAVLRQGQDDFSSLGRGDLFRVTSMALDQKYEIDGRRQIKPGDVKRVAAG